MNSYLISYLHQRADSDSWDIETLLICDAPSQSLSIRFFNDQFPLFKIIAISEIEDPNICIVDDWIEYSEE